MDVNQMNVNHGFLTATPHKCQPVSKFWHLELFDGIYYVIWHLELLGGHQFKKDTLYNVDQSLSQHSPVHRVAPAWHGVWEQPRAARPALLSPDIERIQTQFDCQEGWPPYLWSLHQRLYHLPPEQ